MKGATNAFLVHLFSLVRQDESENLSRAAISAQWIRAAFIVAAGALNTKSNVLWSESRVLRKVRARHPKQLRESLLSEHPDHAFAELYVSLSKGRHRSYSRFYPLLYYIFTFLLDVADPIEYLTSDSFTLDVTLSEELTAFRILIYCGSFATFGATDLTIVQSSFLVLCNVALTILTVVPGYGILRVSKLVRTVLVVLQISLILIFFCIWIVIRADENHVSLPQIVSTMAAEREKNFDDPNLERIVLRNGLSNRQCQRLEQMEELAFKHKSFDAKKARELMKPWYSNTLVDFLIFFLVSGISAILWGTRSRDQVPIIVFLNWLEATSLFLLHINDSVVEKMLFVRLIQIANIPKSRAQRISS